MQARQLLPRSAATVVGVGGMVISLVWTYSVMRVVMASQGGPADSWVIQAAIIGGLVCLFLYAAFGLSAGPRLTLLAWPALFLSLGWIFVTDAHHPPATAVGNSSGIWWADGVLFAVLGGAVLVPLLAVPKARRMLWSDGRPDRDFAQMCVKPEEVERLRLADIHTCRQQLGRVAPPDPDWDQQAAFSGGVTAEQDETLTDQSSVTL